MADELKRKLGEASDSMEWGLHDEALDLLNNLRQEFGDRPEIMEKVKEAQTHVEEDDDEEDQEDRPAPPPTPKEVQEKESGDYEKSDTAPGFHFSPPKSPRFHSDEPETRPEPEPAPEETAPKPVPEKSAPAAPAAGADSFLARRMAALKRGSPAPTATPGPEPSVEIGDRQVPLARVETKKAVTPAETAEQPPEEPAESPPAEPAESPPPVPAAPTMPGEQETEELSFSDLEVVEVEEGNPEAAASGKIRASRKPERKLTPAAVIVDMDALESDAEPEPTVEPEAPKKDVSPEPAAEPEPTAQPEAAAEPETAAEPEATAGPEAEVEPEATVEPEAEAAGIPIEMAAEPAQPVSVTPSTSPPAAKKGKGRVFVGLAVVVVAAAAIGGAFYYFKGPKKEKKAATHDKTASARSDTRETPTPPGEDPSEDKAAPNETEKPSTPDKPAVDKPATRETEKPSARTEPETPRKEEPPKPKKVRLKLTIKPAKARPVVSFRGKKYRGAKFESPPLPPASNSEKVLVGAKGYEKVVLTLTLAEDVNRTVILRPVAKVAEAMKARPRARPRARARARARARRARKRGRRRKKPKSRLIGLD